MIRSHAASEKARPDDRATEPDFDIEIIRSKRRVKTISAKLRNWHTLEIRAPAHLSEVELQQAVDELVQRMLAKRAGYRNFRSDERLEQRAAHYNDKLFGGELRWRSIRWVGNQTRRFGSCTPSRGTIRISDRLMRVPDFVLDYVIVHELVHLVEPNHSRGFWELVYRYKRTERARGYLMALSLEEDLVDAQDE